MTEDEIRLIKQTSGVVLGSGNFADRFYDRLFEIAPETRPLFRNDLGAQKIKFMNMVATLIGSLDHPHVFRTIPQHLGNRHRNYGVASQHYAPVGAALMDALETELGARFTREVRDAWKALYGEISTSMMGSST